MLNTILDSIIIIILVMLAFSPAFVLGVIDKYVFNKKNIILMGRDIFNEPIDIDLNDGETGFNQDVSFERDEKIIKNLRHMVKVSRKKKVKQMWKHKLGEYERKLKWMTTMEKAKGHETLPVI